MNEREQLEQAIAALEAQRAILGDAVVDAALGPMREKLAALQAQAPTPEQRKQATILFADLAGFVAMSEGLDPEEVRAITSRYFHAVTPAIRRHGGRIEKYIGDAIMAVFGIPSAHEHDPEHAIRAALEMQQTVSDLNDALEAEWGVRLAVRIGINTGLVLVGYLGEDFTVVGDTVNLASRLEHAAPVGRVLISHNTYRHVRGLFVVQPLELLRVKGKAEPIQTYVVQEAKERGFYLGSRGVEGMETRMIGRDAELLRLQQALSAVIEEQELQAITVLGEAGVGKSRLLYEYSSWAELLPEGLWLFKGRAIEETEQIPYALFRDVFAFRFGIRDSDPASIAHAKLEEGIGRFMASDTEAVMKAHFIGHLLGFDFSASPHLSSILEDSKQIRDRALHYLTQFFAAVTQEEPAQLLLEDIHWADDASLDLLYHLLQSCQRVPLLILCLARPTLLERRPNWGEGAHYAGHRRMILQPLSKYDIRRLVTEILQKVPEVPDVLRELIVGGSEGNPFYVEELIKMLVEEGVIVPGPEQWQIEAARLATVRVPATLLGVLQARLDALPHEERGLLQCAAVIGRIFWDHAVVYLEPEGVSRTSVPEILARLRQRELLYRREVSTFTGATEYLFKHALLRDVTYESLLKPQRRRYHARAAAWLVEHGGERVDEYAALIAEHYERAGEGIQAATWYTRAGQQAQASHAHVAALGHYQKALTLLPESESSTRLALYEGLGAMLQMQARFMEAISAYTAMRETAESLGDMRAQARAWRGLSWASNSLGDHQAALQHVQQAEQVAQMADAKIELAAALQGQGWAMYKLGNAEAALVLGQRALDLSRTLDARPEMALSLNLLGAVSDMLGRYDQANLYWQEALELYRSLGNRTRQGVILSNLGDTARMRGEYDKAVLLLQEALRIAREMENREGEMTYMNNLGGAWVGLGEYRAAEAELRQVIQMSETTRWATLSQTYYFLAEACLRQGKLNEALDAARQALALGRQRARPEFSGGAWRVLGMVVSHFQGESWSEEELGNPAEYFIRSRDIFTELGMDGERARTLREWALHEMQHGDYACGKAMWQEARSLFDQLGMYQVVQRMDDSPLRPTP